MSHGQRDHIIKFGPYRLETRRRRLYRGEDQVRLTPKTYEILLLLVERTGELVEKDQIIERIWPDHIVEESNLSQQVYRLRRILGDSPKSQEYILTVPGRGYIFNHEVEFKPVGAGAGAAEAEETASAPSGLGQTDAGENGRQPGDAQSESRPSGQGRAGALRSYSSIARPPAIVLMLVAITLFLAATLLGVLWFRSTASADLVVPRIESLVTLPGEEGHPAFSPDGRYVAFTSEGQTRDNQDIYVRMVDEDVMWQVTSHPDKDTQATWSPDGTQIAFLRNTGRSGDPYKLIIVPVRGGDEREVGRVRGGLSWSPDGKYLAVSYNEGAGAATSLCLFSPESGERRILTTTPADVYDTNQHYSPDGKRIAFVRWKNNSASDLYVYTLEGGELKRLTYDDKLITDFEWAPGSDQIYFVSNRRDNSLLWRVDLAGGQPVLEPGAPVDLHSITVSPDGRHLAFTQPLTDTLIEVFRGTGKGAKDSRPICAINSSRADDTPRFSPDGSRIAFVSTRTGLDEIWIANADCSSAQQLTRFNQNSVGSPRWSPDGKMLAFDRDIDGSTEIFTIGINGTDLRQLTNEKAAENMPAWSPDGRWIYFGSDQSSVSRIHRVPVSGGVAEQVTQSPGREAIPSADGRSLYYTNADQLWRKDLLTGVEGPVPGLEKVAVGRYWDIAGGTLYYVSQQSTEEPVVWTLDIESRRVDQLFELPGSLARWVPGITFAPRQNLIAVGYVANRLGDISLIRKWK